jgi:hypothetical protein
MYVCLYLDFCAFLQQLPLHEIHLVLKGLDGSDLVASDLQDALEVVEL